MTSITRTPSPKLYDNQHMESDVDIENIEEVKKNKFKKDPLELDHKKEIAEDFVGVYNKMEEQYKKLN